MMLSYNVYSWDNKAMRQRRLDDNYASPGRAVAMVWPVAVLWETSMKPLAFLGSFIEVRFEW